MSYEKLPTVEPCNDCGSPYFLTHLSTTLQHETVLLGTIGVYREAVEKGFEEAAQVDCSDCPSLQNCPRVMRLMAIRDEISEIFGLSS